MYYTPKKFLKKESVWAYRAANQNEFYIWLYSVLLPHTDREGCKESQGHWKRETSYSTVRHKSKSHYYFSHQIQVVGVISSNGFTVSSQKVL